MKGLIFTFLAIALFSINSSAQDSDYALVEKTVSYYLDGGTNNDFATLKKAFHENATMKFIGGDGYTEVNALEFFEKNMKPGPKSNRKTRVANITVTGNAANAQLVIDYPTFSFIDYMNLLKVKGEWRIVSKIFYRQAREEKM